MQAKEIETRKDYQQYINETVEIILGEYEFEDNSELNEIVFETVDGSQLIIYTDYNLTVLENSYNEPEEWKHLVDESDSYREVIQAMAFDVFRQDLWEEIRNRDIDY